jgi:4-hydroxy-tetrahydrodipicolinate synthase
VALGSLGESATLRFEEKVAVLKTLVAAVGSPPKALGLRRESPLSIGAERRRRPSKAEIISAVPGPSAFKQVPVVAGIASLGTAEAVELARAAEAAGCSGLMVLPPYVYSSDWREMKAHVQAVIRATKLSCMLYNNPIAYKTDFLPEQIRELAAAYRNLHAVKESSGDVKRVTAIKAICGDRLNVLVGMDDAIVEGVRAGAVGWIAGLVNALPKESVALLNSALRGQTKKADELYKWFLPLLRMDTVPKFVQLIKLVQHQTGMGHERVRPPRLTLAGVERRTALETLRRAMTTRPRI